MSLIQDPEDPTRYLVSRANIFGISVGAVIVNNVHSPDRCAGNNCVIHKPSEHHMLAWPLIWRDDIRVFERTCPHGVGHPDPDDAGFQVRSGREWITVHGCDGCCQV